MKHPLFTAFSALAVAILMALFAASCSSSTTNANAAFLGTYYGNNVAGVTNIADTIVITSGLTSSSVILLSRTSLGASFTINGTVNGSTMTIPTQAITLYSAVDTVSGTGSLNSNVLTINYTQKAPAGGSVNWAYTGTKQ